MARVFVSYSRFDEPFARKLATELDHLGADVWIDVDDIPAGVKWSKAIQKGLDDGDVMLVIISPESMTSSNVEDEWQYYLDQQKPVIPIMWKPAKIHFQLNRIQYIDFHHQDFQKAMVKLLDELDNNGIHLQRRSVGSPGVPPVASAYDPGMGVVPARAMPKMLPLYAGLGVLLLIILVAATFLVTRGNKSVENTEALLKAMSERNFGVADDLVCDGVAIQENAFWGEELEDIACTDESDTEVVCTFSIATRGDFEMTFIMEDNLVCEATGRQKQ